MTVRGVVMARGAATRRGAARVTALAGVATLVAGFALFAGAASAQAFDRAPTHNYLVSSTPKAGETLTELPPKFVITTNEPLLTIGGSTAGFGFQVQDAAGKYYTDGCVTVDGAAMTTGAALGAAGDYRLTWQVVSGDGHTVSGEFAFTWAPAGDFTPATGSATPGDCHGSASVTVPQSGAPAPDRNAKVDLGNVLWIGGAVVAVGLAVLIAIIVAGRRKAP